MGYMFKQRILTDFDSKNVQLYKVQPTKESKEVKESKVCAMRKKKRFFSAAWIWSFNYAPQLYFIEDSRKNHQSSWMDRELIFAR